MTVSRKPANVSSTRGLAFQTRKSGVSTNMISDSSRMVIPWQQISIESAWRALGGPELRWRGNKTHARAFWRDGDGFSVSLNRDRSCWNDFARPGSCGGVLRLVETALSCDRGHALEWLERNFGFGVGGEAYNPAHYAKAANMREMAEYWRAGKLRALEAAQAWAHRQSEMADSERERYVAFVQWAACSRELYLTEALKGEALVAAYTGACEADPGEVAEFVRSAVADRQLSVDLTSEVIAAMLIAQLREVRDVA